MKVLFVCTSNVARSPMAVSVFRELAGGGGRHEARSAGLGVGARRRVTTRELVWADVVAVMEAGHSVAIERQWPSHAAKLRVLGVPDDYDPDEPELRVLMTAKIQVLIERLGLARPGRGVGDPAEGGGSEARPKGAQSVGSSRSPKASK
jgi:predicted protein tyrosine phosphatase